MESNEAYHADTSHVSSSMLKALSESPRIFEGQYITNAYPTNETDAMKLGTAVHCLALESDRFDKEYTFRPEGKEGDGRTKEGKLWRQENEHKTILSHEEYKTIYSCVDALNRNTACGKLLGADGVVEKSVRHKDPETGVPCKIRCDKVVVTGGKGIIFDIKTISKLTLRKFAFHCRDFGYAIQDSHYRTITAVDLGLDVSDIILVFGVVETKPPYRCRAFQLDEQSQMQGHADRYELLKEYRARSESGDWSEDGEDEIELVSIPPTRR